MQTKGVSFIYFENVGNSEFLCISTTENLFFDLFLASLDKSNLSVDLLKELNVEKDNSRESVGKTHSISFNY